MSDPIRPFLFSINPLNQGRSPYDPSRFSALPPPSMTVPRVQEINGVPAINGAPLGPAGGGQATPAGQVTPQSIPTYSRALYGDAKIIAVTFTGAGLAPAPFSPFVLARPNNTRISLLIQNVSVAGNIFYNFDQDADNTSSIVIGANGNRIWDYTCPQGNLSLFSSGAGVVVIEYINVDLLA